MSQTQEKRTEKDEIPSNDFQSTSIQPLCVLFPNNERASGEKERILGGNKREIKSEEIRGGIEGN